MNDDLIWAVRVFVYQQFAVTTRAPAVDEIARHFDLAVEQAGQVLAALHEKHALFLDPGPGAIRFANPFSAIATPFRVEVRGKSYWANCAWDCFGIAVALHASEASIHSTCAHSGAALRINITQGQLDSHDELVHFLVPFQHWYDDLVFT